MRAILPVIALIAGLAACDSPTAPRGFADGSVRMSDLNPQPLPPGLRLSTSDLNPQPLPPGLHFSTATTLACTATGTVRTSIVLYEPPDPCLK